MLPASRDALLKLSKTKSPPKLIASHYSRYLYSEVWENGQVPGYRKLLILRFSTYCTRNVLEHKQKIRKMIFKNPHFFQFFSHMNL